MILAKRWTFLRNGTTFFPGAMTPILVAPANVNRVGLVVQAIAGKARIGQAGVTATTGVLIEGPPSAPVGSQGTIFQIAGDGCPTGEVWVIGDGGVATVFVQQIEAP